MQNYTKVATAIEYIRNHVGEQPSLEEIASQVHLSPHHFQRLFCRWAGVSPKRLLQVLTLECAKEQLKTNQGSVLDVADSIGLSSGSRLYDHFVQLEAVTPSEYKEQGLGLTIQYGYHKTSFGLIFIAMTQRGICKLVFVDCLDKTEPLSHLKYEWPLAKLVEEPEQTSKTIQILFSDSPATQAPLSLFVRGTNFQINVWRALLNLQPGQISTYGEIAKAINKPKAVRAVGTAIGANPVALVIPCHRVIRKNGNLGGYRWGETRKHAILAREAAPHVDRSS